MQLTDLFLGALGYHYRELKSSEAKRSIINRIEANQTILKVLLIVNAFSNFQLNYEKTKLFVGEVS